MISQPSVAKDPHQTAKCKSRPSNQTSLFLSGTQSVWKMYGSATLGFICKQICSPHYIPSQHEYSSPKSAHVTPPSSLSRMSDVGVVFSREICQRINNFFVLRSMSMRDTSFDCMQNIRTFSSLGHHAAYGMDLLSGLCNISSVTNLLNTIDFYSVYLASSPLCLCLVPTSSSAEKSHQKNN